MAAECRLASSCEIARFSVIFCGPAVVLLASAVVTVVNVCVICVALYIMRRSDENRRAIAKLLEEWRS